MGACAKHGNDRAIATGKLKHLKFTIQLRNNTPAYLTRNRRRSQVFHQEAAANI
jgi:hypothetical protein